MRLNIRWLLLGLALPILALVLSLLYFTAFDTYIAILWSHQLWWGAALFICATVSCLRSLVKWSPQENSFSFSKILDSFKVGFKVFASNPFAIPSLIILLFFVLAAYFPQLFIVAEEISYTESELRFINRAPSPTHPLGVTQGGQDILSIMVYGTRGVLELAIKATFMAVVLGSILGVVAGYFKRGIDGGIMLIVDTILAFPSLFMMLTVLMITENPEHALWLIAAWGAAQTAKLVRGATLSLRERDYIQAAQATGAGDIEILSRHLLANISPTLAVHAATFCGQAVLMHSYLTFLGFGSGAGWAGVIASTFRNFRVLAIYREPWLVMSAGICLWLLITAFNQIGAALEDMFLTGRQMRPAKPKLMKRFAEALPSSVKIALIPGLALVISIVYLTYLPGLFDSLVPKLPGVISIMCLAMVLAFLPSLKDWSPPALDAVLGGQGAITKVKKLTRRFFGTYKGFVGLALLLFFGLVAIFPQLFIPQDIPDWNSLDLLRMDRGPNQYNLLGLTYRGEDVLTILVTGTRPVLKFGFQSALIAVIVGSVLGAVAGYKGGTFDRVISQLSEIVLSFPSLFMMLTVLAITGNNEHRLWLIVLYGVTSTVKIIRSETLALRNREYVTSALAVGCGDIQIILQHILSNALPLVLVQLSIFAGQAILLDAYVNFLGVAGAVGWAGAIADSMAEFRTLAIHREPWLVGGAGICLLLLILAFNMVGEGLRDAIAIQHN